MVRETMFINRLNIVNIIVSPKLALVIAMGFKYCAFELSISYSSHWQKNKITNVYKHRYGEITSKTTDGSNK